MTKLIDLGGGRWNVVSDKGTFAINESDKHTKKMLSDFQNNDSRLQEFGEILHDVNAFNIYNGIPVEEKKTDEESRKEEAEKFAALVADGDFKGAFYALQGMEKSADVTIQPSEK